MDRKFFRKNSKTSLLKEESKNSLVLLNSSLAEMILNDNNFHLRCLSRTEAGKEEPEKKLIKARNTFFSREDMSNWLCKIKEDSKTETDVLYIKFEAGWNTDKNKIDFEQVGFLAGIYTAANSYLTTLIASEPVRENKAHFTVYDTLEKLDEDYLKTDNLPGYFEVQKEKRIRKHEFEISSLDDYWQDYLSLRERHHVTEGFGDKRHLLQQYHLEFARGLQRIKPRSDVKRMLNYHYDKYDGDPGDFLNHIEYRILPILKEWVYTDYIVYRQLVNEWVRDKRQILSMPDERFLLNSIQECCAAFVNSLAIHKPLNDENKFNTIIKDMLQQSIRSKSWFLSDQSLGGMTDSDSTAASAGVSERDLIIVNQNQQIISAIEFFRLKYIPSNTESESAVRNHLLKVFRNEITGISPLFMIVYCETRSFNSTWEKYLSFIESIDYGNYPLSGVVPVTGILVRANLQTAVSEHKRESSTINLYHIFINMFP